jgi:adenine deaminase
VSETEKRNILSKVALGNVPPDTIVTNGILFNAFTGEFIKQQSIWIKDGMIAYVGPDHDPPKGEGVAVVDANGMVLLPGLIDGHTHAISNRMGIEEFTKHVIPTGTTTVVIETMELTPIVGKDGIEYVAKGLERQPIRFYYTVPAMCCLTPSEEINAPMNEELLPLLKNPRCLGVGEIYWGNIFLEGKQGERVRELVSIGLGLGRSSRDIVRAGYNGYDRCRMRYPIDGGGHRKAQRNRRRRLCSGRRGRRRLSCPSLGIGVVRTDGGSERTGTVC